MKNPGVQTRSRSISLDILISPTAIGRFGRLRSVLEASSLPAMRLRAGTINLPAFAVLMLSRVHRSDTSAKKLPGARARALFGLTRNVYLGPAVLPA